MAEPLSRLIPNADGRLILVIRHRQRAVFAFIGAEILDQKKRAGAGFQAGRAAAKVESVQENNLRNES
jgi:hypothetical protein